MIGHMLAQIKLEYPAELFRVVVPALDTSNLEHLYRVELPECFHQICQTLLDSRTPDNDLPAAVLRFIHENLFSVDMCTTFVADHFGISKPNLQKILKNATGVTFSVFVSTQRMDRAYQLMQEPGVSVQKVAELCGFSSPNSFYKAFRLQIWRGAQRNRAGCARRPGRRTRSRRGRNRIIDCIAEIAR